MTTLVVCSLVCFGFCLGWLFGLREGYWLGWSRREDRFQDGAEDACDIGDEGCYSGTFPFSRN